MSEPTLYRRILAGQTGPWAAPLRGALLGASALYGLGVRGRNRWYDRASAAHRLPIPVISVGNITVGGTGKTPFVIDLVHRFERMKRTWNPVVVSRGYKASWDEPNDEERLIRRNCPAVACLADANRTLAAQRAHRDLGADVIVLDDGFQHRRLSRTLDIVLIDATCPFGYGY
ncbi:MAG: tetraacyldisaccharide 4'-kinase, partial [Planctomycetes bacterium]|nr:tetraacyldisaccharide 4'-kinase [Planctomycetota bacterium]